MRSLLCLLAFEILTAKSFAEDKSSVSSSQAVKNRQNRRLNGHTFKRFSSDSLISCGLHCTRNPRCVSTNFKTESGGKGVCELNDNGIAWPADESNLDNEEGVIFTQYQSILKTYFYKSCKDIRADIPNSPSGLYTVQPVSDGKMITVYCEMAIAGGGFTFVPRSAIRGIESQLMIVALFTDRSRVLMRIQKKNGTQPYTLVEQLPEYKQYLLGARVNNYDGYTSPKNNHMGDYLLLGILPPEATGVTGNILGFQSNGAPLRYTSCDGFNANLFAFLPNLSGLAASNYHSNNLIFERQGMAVDWRKSAVRPPSERTMPNEFFFLTEVHMGGCGCYTSSDRWTDALGTAIGFR